MSGRRTDSFLREAGAGFVLSLAAGALAATLGYVLGPDALARGIVAALGLAYVLRVLARSRETTGRVVAVALWSLTAAAVWLLGPSLPAYVAVHVVMLWLARSLYLHARLLEAGLDLGLSLLAICFAVWAASRADSLFLASWCFFLVQAMHVAIPGLAARLLVPAAEARVHAAVNRNFADALGAADEALRRIAARR